MTKTFACKDMGAATCNYTDSAKDDQTLVNKVKGHIQKVHKEIKNFDGAMEAKVKSVIKEA